jgi:hypothetical protein
MHYLYVHSHVLKYKLYKYILKAFSFRKKDVILF